MTLPAPGRDPSATARLKATAKAPKRVKPGAGFVLRVKVRNNGPVAAAGVRVCLKLAKKPKRAFRALGGAKGCKRAGKLAPGKAKTVRLAMKAKPKGLRAGARYKLGVVVSARDAESGKALPKRKAAARVRGAK